MSASALVQYDRRGNLLHYGDDIYAWDELDQLTTKDFPQHTYVYTADDERIWTIEIQPGQPSKERLTLRGLDPCFFRKVLRNWEITGGNNPAGWSWKKDYIHRGGAHLAAEVSDVPFSDPDRIEHFFVDHLGSIGATTNKLGHIVDSHRYHAFGQEPPDSGQFKPEAMRFTGHERDQNQGNNTVDDLDYMHARYYAPHLGRFLSIDPGEDHTLETPQSWNYYAYARNNPVNNTDPDGRFVAFITDVALQLALYAGGFPDSFYDSTARAYTTGRRATADLMQGRAILDGVASSLASQLAGRDTQIRAAKPWMVSSDCSLGPCMKIGMIPIGPGGGLFASSGTVITGYTRHGIHRLLGDGARRAGVSSRAILDALKNPRKIVKGVDSLGRPFEAFYSASARVVVNPKTGKIISVNPLSAAGIR